MLDTKRYEKGRRGSNNEMIELLRDWVKDYRANGMVMHATRSCRATTVGLLHLKGLVEKYVKVPVLLLTSDIVDVGDYSEADWKKQIDTFMGMVDVFKRGQ